MSNTRTMADALPSIASALEALTAIDQTDAEATADALFRLGAHAAYAALRIHPNANRFLRCGVEAADGHHAVVRCSYTDDTSDDSTLDRLREFVDDADHARDTLKVIAEADRRTRDECSRPRASVTITGIPAGSHNLDECVSEAQAFGLETIKAGFNKRENSSALAVNLIAAGLSSRGASEVSGD